MRDDERDMIERHERQDGIVNGYIVSLGLGLVAVVVFVLALVGAHLAGG